MDSEQATEKLRAAEEILRSFGRAIIAFSGGVDSTLLAKLARDILGKESTLVVTADSPSLSREDLKETRRLALQLDLQHLVIETKEVENLSYRINNPSRCYVCKGELFEELGELAKARRIPVVLYGAIGEDLFSERPGQRAALEFGVRAPLQEVGLEKREVRELAKRLGLPNWDRPQNACLSSRIPHGHEVTEEKLRQVEAAESFLRAHGFRQVRVRHLATHARVEVSREEVPRFHDSTLCHEVARYFEALGFETVSVDRAGYRSGGANHVVADEVPLSALSSGI
jgi:uncharacterized protein